MKDDYSEGFGAMDKTGKFIIPPIYGNLFEEHGVETVYLQRMNYMLKRMENGE